MGEGELKLDSDDGDLPDGLDPVTSIKTVTATDANGNVILQGQVQARNQMSSTAVVRGGCGALMCS
jgi:hypothetical protein